MVKTLQKYLITCPPDTDKIVIKKYSVTFQSFQWIVARVSKAYFKLPCCLVLLKPMTTYLYLEAQHLIQNNADPGVFYVTGPICFLLLEGHIVVIMFFFFHI